MIIRLRTLIAFFTVLLAVGTFGFVELEGLSAFDSLYLTVTTISTVGYGDVAPVTVGGRVFAMLLIVGGVGLAFYVFSHVFNTMLEMQLEKAFGRRGMERKITNMQGHIIVCGTGRVGQAVIRQLLNENANFVVIEKDLTRFQDLVEKKIVALNGDATLDDVMKAAGVERSRGVITTLPSDADNVYVTLTARSLNPDPEFIIVARADRFESMDKLKRAGATTVISPEIMGGRQMATAMIKPVIVDLMDNVFYTQELHLDIAQIMVGKDSELIGRRLAVCGIKEEFDSLIVGIKRGEILITSLSANEIIAAGDILIVIGQRSMLQLLSRRADGI